MSTGYPQPPGGWNGGPEGRIMRQGSAGRLSYNPNTDRGGEDQDAAFGDRRNLHDCDYFQGAAFGDLSDDYGDA